jgi:RES domain-containing protein
MPGAWRLTKTRYLETAWDGEGARRSGGRWNSPGTPVVYVSATLSLALVEVLVHLSSGVLPAYTAVPIEFDDSLAEELRAEELPAQWKHYPACPETRVIGDGWVRDARSALLRVPSVVVPVEFNYLVNPAHPEFARVRIGAALPFPFDPRLLRS